MKANIKLVLGLLGAIGCTTATALAQSSISSGDTIYNPPTPAVQAELESVAKQQMSLIHAGAQALHDGNYALAESNARQAITIGPDAGFGSELLAQTLDAEGKETEALQEYKSMVNAGDNHREDLLSFSLLALKAGRWADAVKAYDKAIPPLTGADLASAAKGSKSDTYDLRAENNFSIDNPQATALLSAAHTGLGILLSMHSDLAGNDQDDLAVKHFKAASDLSPDSELVKRYYTAEVAKVQRIAAFRQSHNNDQDVTAISSSTASAH